MATHPILKGNPPSAHCQPLDDPGLHRTTAGFPSLDPHRIPIQMKRIQPGNPTRFYSIYGATPRIIGATQGVPRQNHGPPPSMGGVTQLFYPLIKKHPATSRPRFLNIYPLAQLLPWTASISSLVRPLSQWFSCQHMYSRFLKDIHSI